jgi:hypothetical protein
MSMRDFSRMSQAVPRASSSFDGDGLTSALGGATVVTSAASQGRTFLGYEDELIQLMTG